MSGRPAVDTAIIVAGGQSTRMGTDKAALVWNGVTLLERADLACRAAGLRHVVIVGRERPLDWKELKSVFLADGIPHAGPLSGVVTGLEHLCVGGRQNSGHSDRDDLSSLQYALALSCDMPALDIAALSWLTSLADTCRNQSALGAAAVTSDGRLQPLFAVYSTELLPVLRERLLTGQRSLGRMIESEGLLQARLPPEIAPAVAGVNTPEEFERMTRGCEDRLIGIPRGMSGQE